jgi:hypothetical protein
MKSVMAELAIFFQARRIEGMPHSSSAYSSATALTIPHIVDLSPQFSVRSPPTAVDGTPRQCLYRAVARRSKSCGLRCVVNLLPSLFVSDYIEHAYVSNY